MIVSTSPMIEGHRSAARQGGPAMAGADLDYEVINNMLMVSACGTAVTLERKD